MGEAIHARKAAVMGHFSDFYDDDARVRFRALIKADPSQRNARNHVGEVISQSGQHVPFGPSVKQGFQLICSSLMYSAECISAVEQRAKPLQLIQTERLGLPPLLWIRVFLAIAMLLLATFWAGSFETRVTCAIDGPGIVAPAGSEPAKQVCQQTVQVPQSHVLASAMIFIGIILLLLESAAALTRMLSARWFTRGLAPPAWLDPYVREWQPPSPANDSGELAVRDEELDRNLARAFEQLDKAASYFHEPSIERIPVPINILSFLQRAWVHAAQGDQARLQNEMTNIVGLLLSNGVALVEFSHDNRAFFDLIEQKTLPAPVTTLPAMVDAKSGQCLVQGEAFVPAGKGFA
jgi:hypothetical protein